MKYISLILISLLSFGIQAQVKLKPGMKIITHSSVQSESEYGAGMSMSSDVETESEIMVNEEKKNIFEITSKLTGFKIKMNMLGQETFYDSKNEKDKDSEAGQLFSQLIGMENKFMVNKTDGKVFPLLQREPVKDVSPSMMPSTDDVNGTKKIAECFFVITNDQKKLGNWSVTDSASGTVTIATYTIKRISADEATVSYISNSTNNNTMDQMGMAVKMNIVATGKGELICDLNSMLVKRNSVTTESTGSMEAGGQTTNISGKTISVTTFNVL